MPYLVTVWLDTDDFEVAEAVAKEATRYSPAGVKKALRSHVVAVVQEQPVPHCPRCDFRMSTGGT